MEEEVPAKAGTKYLDTSDSELSGLENTEFFMENPQLDMDADFRPGIDTSFSPTVFNDLEMGEGESSENPIVSDEEEDRENSPPTISVSEPPTEPHKFLRRHPSGRRIDNVPKLFLGLCLKKISVRVFNIAYKQLKCFSDITVFSKMSDMSEMKTVFL